MVKNIFAILLAFLLMFSGCDDSTSNPAIDKEIKIGALIPLSGALKEQGALVMSSIKIAIDELNIKFRNDGIGFELISDDNETDPNSTRVLLSSYLNQNIRIIVGPMTSGVLSSVQDQINESESLLISPSSTAPELAVENDNIFRLIPNDKEMGKAIAGKIWSSGRNKLLMVYRDDIWGKTLNQVISEEFTRLGGNVILSEPYSSARASEYLECLDNLSDKLETDLAGADKSKIAVQISTLEEGADLLFYANQHSSLKEIQWFGSEGVTLSEALFQYDETIGFIRAVDFTSPMYKVEPTAASDDFVQKFISVTGKQPTAFVYLAYDAVFAAATALVERGESAELLELRSGLRSAINNLQGVTGDIELNAADDRSTGLYEFWEISSSGQPQWIKE